MKLSLTPPPAGEEEWGTIKTLPRYYYLGALNGAIREVSEEINVLVTPDRLKGLKMLYTDSSTKKDYITHELKNRFFFVLELMDEDFEVLKGDSILDEGRGLTGCGLPPEVDIGLDGKKNMTPLHGGQLPQEVRTDVISYRSAARQLCS